MMTDKKIGKIQKASIGFGGYQDAQFGLSVTLGSDKDSWGVSNFIGFWASPPSTGAQWTVDDQTRRWGEMCRQIVGFLEDAKITDAARLVGVPVEVEFDGTLLKSWRILTEAI